jgi:hypothetical protein
LPQNLFPHYLPLHCPKKPGRINIILIFGVFDSLFLFIYCFEKFRGWGGGQIPYLILLAGVHAVDLNVFAEFVTIPF